MGGPSSLDCAPGTGRPPAQVRQGAGPPRFARNAPRHTALCFWGLNGGRAFGLRFLLELGKPAALSSNG